MADGRHFENGYIFKSQPRIVRIWRNLVGRRKFWPNRRKCEKKSEIPKFKMADGRHIESHFLAINSAPYCPIKTKFGMRRHNRTHTKVRWWKCQISKIQHGGQPPFWKSLYLPISAANCPNFTKQSLPLSLSAVMPPIHASVLRPIHETVCGHKFYPRRRKRHKRNHKFPNSRWHIVNYFTDNSAPSCPIKTKFGVRSHNRTHTKVGWWKCPISKIQHGRRQPFWKSLYLHISAANRPSCTKFSMQTQILPQATETTKKSEIRKLKMADGRGIKNHFWL